MDNVTHTLFALTLARTPLGRGGRGSTAALVLASNAPDIDIVATLGGGASYLEWHRGPTHGLLGIVGLGLVTAALVWGGRQFIGQGARGRGQSADAAAPFAALLIASLAGVLAHILMDLPTSYGTRLLSPFSWRWFAIDLLPIIDIYLLIALVTGLVVGRRSVEMGRRCAAIVLVVMAVHYGTRGIAHHEALKLIHEVSGATLPPACDGQTSMIPLVESWPRTPPGDPTCLVETAALPTLLSPFQWRVVAQLPHAYWVYDVDVLDRRSRSAVPSHDGLWIPNQWTPAVIEAAKTRTGRIFLGFSRFPAAAGSVDPAGVTTVRLTDMRFAVVDPKQDVRRPAPFTLTVRSGPGNKIIEERLGQ